MGVPAFFQWLRERYPSMMHPVVEGDALEEAYSSEERPVQECDALYLDLNGIVHPCCHPEEGQPVPETEEEMLVRVKDHVDRLVEMMRPTKFVYLAIDGVAPRAKMNQQRTRRYVAAQERADSQKEDAELRAEFVLRGETPPPPKKASWDHNVITPGTKFMAKLASTLRDYCASRYRHPRWRGVSFVFSDATVPGEGEHKIVDYIRRQRRLPGYDATTRHCIVGEDADLIMLSLALHEEHALVLRKRMKWEVEEQDDEAPKPGFDAAPFGYHLVQVGVLRESLCESLCAGDAGWYRERVIDDFVFLCFFCGNDFLPHLPSLDIREGALDVLLELYTRRQREALQLGDALICDQGVLVPQRAASFLEALSKLEGPIFQRRAKREEKHATPMNETPCSSFVRSGRCSYAEKCGFLHGDHCPRDRNSSDASSELRTRLVAFAESAETTLLLEASLSSFQRKHCHATAEELGLTHESEGADRRLRCSKTESFKGKTDDQLAQDFVDQVKKRIEARSEVRLKAEVDDVKLGENGWRDRYYETKLHVTTDEEAGDSVKQVCSEYWRGLQWVLSYYYNGCVSWRYFYARHYAPFAVDLFNHAPKAPPEWDLESIGAPLPPLAQLLAVIPAGSAACLPRAARLLMGASVEEPGEDIVLASETAKTELGEAALLRMFPRRVALDPNGQRHQWQWVALLPFLDDTHLATALNAMESTFSEDERHRNTLTDPLAGFGRGAGDAEDPPPEIAFLGLRSCPRQPSFYEWTTQETQRHVCAPVGGATKKNPCSSKDVWRPGEAAGVMQATGEKRRHPRMRLADLEISKRILAHALPNNNHGAMMRSSETAQPLRPRNHYNGSRGRDDEGRSRRSRSRSPRRDERRSRHASPPRRREDRRSRSREERHASPRRRRAESPPRRRPTREEHHHREPRRDERRPPPRRDDDHRRRRRDDDDHRDDHRDDRRRRHH